MHKGNVSIYQILVVAMLQFAYDANFQTAANTKDYDEFKYLGEQLAFSLHAAVYNFCNFLGS